VILLFLGRTYLVTANATSVANTGGDSRRITVWLYKIVVVRVGENALNEREMMIQVTLNAADKSNLLSGNAENDVLQCHVSAFQSVSAPRGICLWLLNSV
jgi:hypothetical protein